MKPSELLCNRFSFSLPELRSYLKTCPYRYKTYPIDKRNDKGKRYISQPSKDLKIIQRYVLENFLNERLEIHDAAKAYRRKINIIDNARPHLKNGYLLKMDFKDFFPSLTGSDFYKYLLSRRVVDDEFEANLLCMIFFKQHD